MRYRLHVADLPGTPDIVFPRARVVVLVHGCFWHRHAGCRLASMPKSNLAFWKEKFVRNVDRDERKTQALHASGWRVFVVWQCEAEDPVLLARKVDELEDAVRPVGLGSGSKAV